MIESLSAISNWFLDHYTATRDFAGPVTTLVAAIAATWITISFGRRQASIAQSQRDIALDKLKFELFETRYGIYLKAKKTY